MDKYNSCYLKDLTLEGYIKLYNEVMYPLNYPYYIRMGVRSDKYKLSLVVQIGIPKDTNLESESWDIDAPTEYNFQDILTIYGDTDEEIISMFEKLEFHHDHKEYFKSLWKN